MPPRGSSVPLPSPGVHFAPEFHRRVEGLGARLLALRERREGAGAPGLSGGGLEFVGHRPYRPGEDLRMLDWAMIARLDRPFVRVARRETAEHWSILVDDSASMGVGQPGKLQWSAEVAAAFGIVGLRAGATVEVDTTSGSTFRARRHADFARLLAFLGSLEASGADGVSAWLARRRVPAAVGRVFLLGDFITLEPRALRSLFRRGRELSLLQVLAPVELSPPEGVAVEWVDPETGERCSLQVDAERRSAYERALRDRLEGLGAFAARHRIRYRCWSSASPFEEAVHDHALAGSV